MKNEKNLKTDAVVNDGYIITEEDGFKIALKKDPDGKKDKKVLAMDFCKDYQEYLKSGRQYLKESPKGSETFIPKDAMSLEELGKKTKAEIFAIYQKLAIMDNKSNICVMYAHGYGFSWTKLQIIIEFLGLKNGFLVESELTPDTNDIKETDSSSSSLSGKDSTIYIERGKREGTTSRKVTLSLESDKKINEITYGLGNMETSKVIEAIIKDPIDKAYELKKNGELRIVYKAIAEEELDIYDRE